MKNLLFTILSLFLFFSCADSKKNDPSNKTKNEPTNTYTKLDSKARVLFATLPKTAVNPNNKPTPEKIALGKALYFDKRLSKDNTQSCNTCHNLNTYGVDNNSFSKGNNGDLGGRNSPTVLNSALHLAQFWDGREPDVEAQAGGPILNPIEMAMPSEKFVEKKLSGINEYKNLFAKAFPNDKNPITYNNLKKAIGVFERQLITPSKFDEYIAGNNKALSDNEKKGLETFINSGCITCHSGALLGGTMFQKFGLFTDYWTLTKSKKIDLGKFEVTKKEGDKYVFKVPSLRNIEKTGPYFHDGSVASLDDAIAIMAKTQVGKDLSTEDINQIKVFLNTLTGSVPEALKN